MIRVQPLDKGSHIPLYLQLSGQLTRLIQQRILSQGDRLPSERELAEMLNVSRITARQAVEELLDIGLIYREQGKGTFVAESKMRGLLGFASFTEDMKNRGMVPCSRIISQEVVAVDDKLAETLHLNSGEPALHVVRRRREAGAGGRRGGGDALGAKGGRGGRRAPAELPGVEHSPEPGASEAGRLLGCRRVGGGGHGGLARSHGGPDRARDGCRGERACGPDRARGRPARAP